MNNDVRKILSNAGVENKFLDKMKDDKAGTLVCFIKKDMIYL